MTDVMRTQYRKLTLQEKQAMDDVKRLARELYDYIEDLTPPGREFSLAKTKVEEAVMWAVKGITAPQQSSREADDSTASEEASTSEAAP